MPMMSAREAIRFADRALEPPALPEPPGTPPVTTQGDAFIRVLGVNGFTNPCSVFTQVGNREVCGNQYAHPIHMAWWGASPGKDLEVAFHALGYLGKPWPVFKVAYQIQAVNPNGTPECITGSARGGMNTNTIVTIPDLPTPWVVSASQRFGIGFLYAQVMLGPMELARLGASAESPVAKVAWWEGPLPSSRCNF